MRAKQEIETKNKSENWTKLEARSERQNQETKVKQEPKMRNKCKK